MANYISSLNQMLVSVCEKIPRVCLFGQNINTGTYISGLSKGLKVPADGKIINNSNCENTVCGMGFGVMLNGESCVYFVKQLDFMLLGIDHFVNTYNFIRCSRDVSKLGSFSIVMLICDQGGQGPQSSFDSFGDFCSIARIPCYTITNNQDAAAILPAQLGAPGFRMIGLSSRLCKTEFPQLNCVYQAKDSSVFQYTEGADVTIACYNFSLYEGQQLAKKLADAGLSSSLFSVNYVVNPETDRIVQSVAKTRKLIVMDDSKSVHLPAYKLLDDVSKTGVSFRRQVVTRGDDIEFGMTDDLYKVDYDAIVAAMKAG
jgi:pyruvate/2-oxoglutarate/acetoin dehydrogenase E1 component